MKHTPQPINTPSTQSNFIGKLFGNGFQLKSRIFSYIQLLILISSFLILFNHTIIELVKDWSTNANYSHGFLVPFISAYMIWRKKKELISLPLTPNNWGLFIIVMGMMMHIVGNIGAELFIMRSAIIFTILGLAIYFTGAKITKKIIIPIAYLTFMIPLPAIIWNKIAFPLQIFASNIAEMVIQLLGIPILREGNILYLTNTILEVADACSGLRSLITLLALSAAFAYISGHSKIKKWILLISAIPIAILVNIIRLILTASLADHFSAKIAQGFLHEFSGLVIYILALIMLGSLHVALLKINRKNIPAKI